MSGDVGKATEGFENELWHRWHEQSSFSNLSVTSPTSQLIQQPFLRFTYVTAHSPTLPSLYLRHSSFSNFSVALRTSQLILQPFRRFTYVTTHSPTPRFTYVTAHSPTVPLLHLRHSSFSNLSFASRTSQALHLFHLACRTWCEQTLKMLKDPRVTIVQVRRVDLAPGPSDFSEIHHRG